MLESCLRLITTYPQPKNSRDITGVGLRIVREEYPGVDQVGVVGVPPARGRCQVLEVRSSFQRSLKVVEVEVHPPKTNMAMVSSS